MQSETIQLGQKVRYTVNCGKTWRVGTLTGYNEKTVSVTTRKQVTRPTYYHFMGIIKIKTGIELVWADVVEKLPALEACTSVITLGQYAEMQKQRKAEIALFKIALKYAS